MKSWSETIYETQFFLGLFVDAAAMGVKLSAERHLAISKHIERESAKLTGIARGRVCLHFLKKFIGPLFSLHKWKHVQSSQRKLQNPPLASRT